MQFDDDYGPRFSALTQPISFPLSQPPSLPSSLFSGGIPAVHFAPVTPVQFGEVSPVHVGEHHPIFQTGVVHAEFHFGPAQSVLGEHVDIRG